MKGTYIIEFIDYDLPAAQQIWKPLWTGERYDDEKSAIAARELYVGACKIAKADLAFRVALTRKT
jgi:hypothetical protein